MAADPRKTSLLTRSWQLVLALAILFSLLAVATLPARRHAAEALLLARGDGVDVLARSYAEQIVHPSFLAQIRPRIRPIDGHRLTDDELRDSISAHSVDSAGLVHVTARAGSAQGAEALANDVAVAFSVAVKQEAQQHEAFVRDELRSRVAQRAREIARLRTGRQSAVVSERLQELQAERNALVDQLAHASVLGARQSVGPMLVAPPHAALEPLLPRLVRRLFEGLLFGGLVGFVALGLLRLRAGRERRSFDDPQPLERTASAAREPEQLAQSLPLPQPVVRATAPSPPSAAAPLMLVADPPLPPPAPATTPLPVHVPVALLPRPAGMLELAELERLVVERPAPDPYLQEERHALLVSLRGYTGLDGVIPTRFHSLVHESFDDLLDGGAAVGAQA